MGFMVLLKINLLISILCLIVSILSIVYVSAEDLIKDNDITALTLAVLILSFCPLINIYCLILLSEDLLT